MRLEHGLEGTGRAGQRERLSRELGLPNKGWSARGWGRGARAVATEQQAYALIMHRYINRVRRVCRRSVV